MNRAPLPPPSCTYSADGSWACSLDAGRELLEKETFTGSNAYYVGEPARLPPLKVYGAKNDPIRPAAASSGGR